MKIQQLLYTSCKKGLSSGAGFQTYSMSKGITEEERKEIETYCVYIPPDNLPTQPTEEEIEKLFPLSFSYFILKSGKYCISQGKYIGRDYSGRYGNYICHVLIFDNPCDFYPIELYKSISFRGSLTLEEQNASCIEYLPELDHIHLGNVIYFDSISKFFKENGIVKKSKNFREMMQSIIDFNKSGKKIMFCDSMYTVPYLIGAIEMSLPKKLSMQFTFTTYAYNPEDTNYLICAAYGIGSKSNFNIGQNIYKYNIFNFLEDRNKNVKFNSNFSKLAEIGFTVSKEIFLPFIDFLTQFEYKKLDEDIDDCLCLYNMVKKGLSKSDVESVKKAVNFAINYKSIEAYKQLFCELQPNLEKISTEVDVELTEIITKFLFKMSKETGFIEHRKIAYEFFFNSIHYLIVDAEEISINTILNLYKNIRSLNDEQFVKKSLEEVRINELITYMEGAKPRHAKFYFEAVLCDVKIFNKNSVEGQLFKLFDSQRQENKTLTIFLYKCLGILRKYPDYLRDVLNFFKDDYEYAAKIVLTIYCKCIDRDNILKELLIDFIVEKGKEKEDWKNRMYFYISKDTGGSDFLLSIYAFELSKRSIKEKFFINYCNEVFNTFESYKKEKFKEALNLYLNYCKNDDMCSDDITLEEYEAILNYIMNNSLLKYMDKAFIKKVISMFENKINNENQEIDDFILKKLFNVKKQYKIKTSCSIIELSYIGNELEKYGFRQCDDLLKNIKCDYKEMYRNNYEKYLKWFLPNICIYLKDDVDHGKVKKALYCADYGEIYFEQYIKVIKEIVLGKNFKSLIKSLNINPYKILLDFVIFTLKNMYNVQKTAEETFNNGVIDILKEVSEKKIKACSRYVIEKTKRCKDREEIMIRWRHITKTAVSMEKGPLLKIKNLFN
ncbi:hypothetical protein [Clostridium scatologenes]|uniref:Uncharacterized protein n=1 Tax=Clostridium scatologenes TaxID=1548 RepID=A0A0E3M5N9_CLOSL|nr:hypothetical protein [Clostridium scatologenes]AKA68369.1 hypothetical protein CSCA_1244 [Clostridium scatologenes]